MSVQELEAKAIWTMDEFCEYTGFTKKYAYELTSTRVIPHSKPSGKKVFFSRDRIKEWLLGNEVKTSEEINAEAASMTMRMGRIY